MRDGQTTDAGHSPQALTVLTGALEPHMAKPACDRLDTFSTAVDVFRTLHDAGLRIVESHE